MAEGNGEKPNGLYPCYVQCPCCGEYDDYFQVANQTGLGQTDIVHCIHCKRSFRVRGIAGGLEALECISQ